MSAGLVIYWFGFVEDAAAATNSQSLEHNITAWATQGIQVASRLPETIIKPKGASMKVCLFCPFLHKRPAVGVVLAVAVSVVVPMVVPMVVMVRVMALVGFEEQVCSSR